jgi:thermospermine synthase
LQSLQEWGGQAVNDDPRFELVIGDAYVYLLNCREKFDVIVMDISDPIEAGPGVMLYTRELYQHVVDCLSPNGVFVTQAGAADAVPPPHANTKNQRDTICFGPIRNTLQEVFDCVLPYSQCVPSFGSDWGFVMAFNCRDGRDSKEVAAEWTSISPSLIDELVQKHIKSGEASLKMYDGITHLRMFHLSKGKSTRLRHVSSFYKTVF